jgi:hypothetical protein
MEFERRQASREQCVAQIAEENPWAGRQFDQKPRCGRLLLDLKDG